ALPPAGAYFDHDHRRIVNAAVAVGGLDQVVANALRVAQTRDGPGQHGLGHHARQAIAAEHQIVSRPHRYLVEVYFDLRLEPKGAQEDVLLLGLQALLTSEQARAHLRVHQRMILRQRLELVIAPQIGATVSDVGEAGDALCDPR